MIVHIFIKGVDLMEEKYSLNRLNYRIYGEGKDALLLHGWGQSTYQMLPIAHILQGYRCLVVDLPGFGESCVPENVLTIKDYALIINRLCQKLKFKPSLVIGHSFGGKVAYAYALSHKVEHLVLAAPSIIKPIKTIGQKARICLYKILKKVNNITNNKFRKIMNKLGSKDYQNSHGVMRRIMVSSVNTYYDDSFATYQGRVLLVYGSNDKITPLSEGKKIKSKLNNASLKIINKGDHFAYLEKRYTFVRYIQEFIGSED